MDPHGRSVWGTGMWILALRLTWGCCFRPALRSAKPPDQLARSATISGMGSTRRPCRVERLTWRRPLPRWWQEVVRVEGQKGSAPDRILPRWRRRFRAWRQSADGVFLPERAGISARGRGQGPRSTRQMRSVFKVLRAGTSAASRSSWITGCAVRPGVIARS